MDAFLDRALRKAAGVLALLRRREHAVPFLTILFLLSVEAVRALGNDFIMSLGHPGIDMFFGPETKLADFYKAALSLRDITGQMITSHAYKSWPALYQDYLLQKNIFHGIEVKGFHIPPFSGLLFIGAARLIMGVGLWLPYALFLAVYLVAIAGLVLLLRKAAGISRSDVALVIFLFLLSYPALWMFQRSNFHAGYTNVLVTVYFITAAYGRFRVLGWMCLAVAANIRPNVALFATMEFLTCATLLQSLRSILAAALMTIGLIMASYFLMHWAYPAYTIEGFLADQRLYNEFNIKLDLSGLWNNSLYEFTQFFRRYILRTHPYYSDGAYLAVTVLAVPSYLEMLFVALRKQASAVELSFLLCCFTALFTPVFAYYHMLEFAGPLLLVVADSRRLGRVRRQYYVPFATCLLVLVPISGSVTNGVAVALLLVAASIVTVAAMLKRNKAAFETGRMAAA